MDHVDSFFTPTHNLSSNIWGNMSVDWCPGKLHCWKVIRRKSLSWALGCSSWWLAWMHITTCLVDRPWAHGVGLHFTSGHGVPTTGKSTDNNHYLTGRVFGWKGWKGWLHQQEISAIIGEVYGVETEAWEWEADFPSSSPDRAKGLLLCIFL